MKQNGLVIPRVDIQSEDLAKSIQTPEYFVEIPKRLKKSIYNLRPISLKYSEDNLSFSRNEKVYIRTIQKLEADNKRLEKELYLSKEEIQNLQSEVKRLRSVNQGQQVEINHLKTFRQRNHLLRTDNPKQRSHSRNRSFCSHKYFI